VELLTEFDFEQAQQFASEIEQYNSDRKDLDNKLLKKHYYRLKRRKTGLPQSSIRKLAQRRNGIVASRLNYYRPTLFYQSGDKYAPRHDQSKVLTSIMHSKPALNI
jgi:single-stranded-DNA-specific exonuclease